MGEVTVPFIVDSGYATIELNIHGLSEKELVSIIESNTDFTKIRIDAERRLDG